MTGWVLSARQGALAHEELVDRLRGLAAFADRPDDERLSTPDVAGREHLWAAGNAIVALVGVDAGKPPARNDGQRQLVDHVVLDRSREAHGEQHEIGRASCRE